MDDKMLYDLYADIKNDITQEEVEEQNKIYNDTQCIFHFFNMDMTDKGILEKWNNETICEELVQKLNEIKEKFILTEEEEYYLQKSTEKCNRKMEEVAPILSEEEMLKAFQQGIVEGISLYSRRRYKNG